MAKDTSGLMTDIFSVPYLNTYLRMVEDTESPRIFHIWSAVFGVSCALGRRCWFPFWPNVIYPNQFILFVGTPGTRKTTATGLGKHLIKQSTGTRFAPGDTGFHRQGLVLAFQGGSPNQEKEYMQAAELGGSDQKINSIMDLAGITNVPSDYDDVAEIASYVDPADKHHMAIVASEFSAVVGQSNLAMMDFLGSRYDGEDYEYQTSSKNIKLKGTLLNMLAGTTPTSIANALPPQAGGQGFLSRIILVYGAKKYKFVSRPAPPPEEYESEIKSQLENIHTNFSGAFSETDQARAFNDDLYRNYQLEITDSRFVYYAERRNTHLIKLTMALCAMRDSMEITLEDFEEAHKILKATEIGMPDALGEFGMNPLAQLKQEILEQLRGTMTAHSMEQLLAMFHRDARSVEIQEVINDLIHMKQISMQTSKTGQRLLIANFTKQNTEDAMMRTLKDMMIK